MEVCRQMKIRYYLVISFLSILIMVLSSFFTDIDNIYTIEIPAILFFGISFLVWLLIVVLFDFVTELKKRLKESRNDD